MLNETVLTKRPDMANLCLSTREDPSAAGPMDFPTESLLAPASLNPVLHLTPRPFLGTENKPALV